MTTITKNPPWVRRLERLAGLSVGLLYLLLGIVLVLIARELLG
jgi:hypothetical protein